MLFVDTLCRSAAYDVVRKKQNLLECVVTMLKPDIQTSTMFINGNKTQLNETEHCPHKSQKPTGQYHHTTKRSTWYTCMRV